MPNLSRLDVIRLFAFSMLLLIFPATSWGSSAAALQTDGQPLWSRLSANRRNPATPSLQNSPRVTLSRWWEWNPKTDTVSYQGKDKSGEPVNVTYQRSQLGSQSNAIEKQIDPAFINDQYWLLFPFHVISDGSATVTDNGMQKLPIGDGAAERLVMKYSRRAAAMRRATVGTLCRRRQAGRADDLPPGGTAKPKVVIATWVGYKQAVRSWSQRITAGRQTESPYVFSFGRVGESEGIRRLDQSAMNIGRAAEQGAPPCFAAR